MRFGELARYLEKLEKTSSRLSITEILSDLFKKSEIVEIDKICYLVLGQLAPAYESVVFNVADKMVVQVLSRAYEKDGDEVRRLYKRKGDMGTLTEELASAKHKEHRTKILHVSDVFEKLERIAKDEGEGSQERKVEGLSELLKSLDPLSAKYVVRIVLGKLRLGFSDKTILDALSWMLNGDKSAKSDIESVYNVYPDVGWIARKIKEGGISKSLKEVKLKVGVPPYLMLGQRLKSPSEMIEKMGEVLVEPKFDGLRIQIHYKKDFVKAYTRNLNETTWMFPELKDVGEQIKAKEVILDCEAMGVDERSKKLANFQTTMTRRRKHNIGKVSENVSIKFYVFDILLKNGKSLLDKSLEDRKIILSKTIKNPPAQSSGEARGKILEVVEYLKTKDPKVIANKMNRYLGNGLEGVFVKRANSKYVAGRTGWRWVKMKQDEKLVAKMADTVDCVVMGYYSGRGKRTEFGVGGFLVGIVNNAEQRTKSKQQSKERILTLTKIGTGLTDEQFRELKKRLSDLETKQKPKEYGKVEKTLVPDYWVEPKQVVEIAADEITKSPLHSSGYALRFPRLVKFRDDKRVDQATSVVEVIKIYKLQ